MAKKMVIIDKYEFCQEQGIIYDQAEMFVANNKDLKKKVLLMRYKRNDQNLQTYNRLLHEASLLRKLNHDGIQICHKLIKTKHNLYIIYEFVQGDSVQKALVNNHLDFKTKINIAKQLSSIILQLSKHNIVHAAINLQNIIVNNHKIKLINFQYAQYVNEELLKTNLVHLPPISLYSAPQISEEASIHLNSDIYSFGTIILTLFQKQFQRIKTLKQKDFVIIPQQSPSERWLRLLLFLSVKMIKKQPSSRISLKQILIYLNFDHPYANKVNLGISDNNNNIVRVRNNSLEKPSQKSNKQSYRRSKSLNTINTLQNASSKEPLKDQVSKSEQKTTKNQILKVNEKDQDILFILRKVFKIRNISAILLYMLQNLIDKQISTQDYVKLQLLILKIISIMLLKLNKMMLVMTHQQDKFGVKSKLQQSISYLSLRKTIYKQCVNIAQNFRALLDESKEYPILFNDIVFLQQIQSPSINQAYIKQMVYKALKSMLLTIDKQYLKQYKLSQLIAIYILSLILFFNTYEEAFQQLFYSFTSSFQNQLFFKQMNNFSKDYIVKQLSKNLKNYQKIAEQQKLRKNKQALHTK